MSVSRREVAQAIQGRITAGSGKQAVAREIAGFLLETRRVRELDGLLRDVARLRRQAGVIEVTVAAARPLSDVMQQDVRELIASHYPDAQKIIVNQDTDPSLLGGIRLKTGDFELDATVRRKLNRLKIM